jgi:nickel-dependent lactate racemase
MMDITGKGSANQVLSQEQVESIVAGGLSGLALSGQRVLVLIPDQTRTMPLPLFFRLLTRHLLGKVKSLDFLVALGTHPPLNDEALLRLVGITRDEKDGMYREVRLFNHAWQDPEALVVLGYISPDEMASLSDGRLVREVPIRLNRRILDYDHLLICCPVFPHEIAGFSGGNKYFFPGIAGPEIIHFTHWLGALITSYEVIGVKDNPIRRVMDRAAEAIPRPRHALCAVVTGQGISGLYFGSPESAYSAAADLSRQVHVQRVEKPYHQVLSMLPAMYPEIWTGAKGMYKVEPVVAEGGEVILYAPHITEFSLTHGETIRQVGYHVRDFFVKQWEAYCRYPWGVLAHSTHLRGIGTYKSGVERPRIQVTLATGIPEGLCKQVNLGYRDPAQIDPQAWAGQEDEGLLLVPHAGERLYRLKSS